MLRFLIIPFLLLSQVVFSQVDKEHIKNAGFEPDGYIAKTIILKVKNEYRQECTHNNLNILEVKQLFNQLGVIQLKKKFPNNRKPSSPFKRITINDSFKKTVDLSLIFEYKYSGNLPLNEAILLFRNLPYFEYVQGIPRAEFLFTPDDGLLSKQYYLGVVEAYAAWDIEQGDTNIVVGITDTGTELTHPDLKNKIKHNYADPINGIDDDGDGYIDNFNGWDLGVNDNDPTYDVNAHGVFVTGMASAEVNNTIGVAGVGYKTKYLPVKITNASGTITQGYAGITYAADHGCKIINASWGSTISPGQFGQDVIDYAVSKGALVVASAGNSNNSLKYYPASLNDVINVTASSSADTRWGGGNFYKEIDIAAPGASVKTTSTSGGYKNRNGTSLAAPFFSGCAAIVASKYPSYSGIQIGELLKATSDNIDSLNPGYENLIGKGRVNLKRALTEFPPAIQINNIIETSGIGTLNISATFTNILNPSSVNLKATLSTNSAFVSSITDSVSNLGVIPSMGSVSNTGDPFKLVLAGGIPSNTTIPITITFNDGLYNISEFINIIVNKDFIDINDNLLSTTLTSKGKIGFNQINQGEGQGIRYNSKPNMIWESSFIVGAQGDLVSDNVRGIGSANDADFVAVNNITKQFTSKFSDNEYKTTFNDDNNLVNNVGVEVVQKNYTWNSSPDDKYVIYEYLITNTSEGTLNNLYAGHFTDWDINNFSKNSANADTVNKIGYSFDTQINGLYGAVKLLTASPFVHYAFDNISGGGGGINLNDGFSETEKYLSLQGGKSTAGVIGSGNDVLDLVASGPFTLLDGESVKVAFALIAGSDLLDIQTSAAAAQAKYDAIPTCVAGTVKLSTFGATTICFGDSVKLSLPSDPIYESYNWNTLSSDSTIQAKKSGQYFASIIDTLGCTHISDTVKVVVNSLTRTITKTGANTFCLGDSVILNAGLGLNNINWNLGDTSQIITSKTAGINFFTANDGIGCPISSDTLSVSLYAPQVLKIGVAGSATFCNGDKVDLDGGATFTNHSWNTGLNSQVLSASTPGNYYLTANDGNGCLTQSDSISVSVNQPQKIKISKIGSLNFCEGDSVILDGNTAFTDHSWNTGNTTSSITIKANGSYFLTAKDSNGCFSLSDTLTAIVNPLTRKVLKTGPNTFCIGDSVALDAGLGLTDINWSTGETAQIITSKTTKNIFFTAKDAIGCIINSDTVLVTVNFPKVLKIGVEGVTTFCIGREVDLDGGTSFTNHKWNTGVSTQKISPSKAGVYFLSANDINGCLSQSDTVSISIITETKSSQIKGKAQLNGFGIAAEKAVLYYDFSTVPYKQKEATINQQGEFLFDSLPKGEYLIKVFPKTSNAYLIPTYFGDTYDWKTATKLETDCGDTLEAVINFIPTSNSIGDALINGYVYNTGATIEGATIILNSQKFGITVGAESSDALGNFWFKNIAIGNYKLELDYPGYTQDTLINVSASPVNTQLYSIDFCLEDKDNSVNYCQGVTGAEEYILDSHRLTVFPNPFNEQFSISYTLLSETDIQIDLVNVLGNLVITMLNTQQQLGDYLLRSADLKNEPFGVYFVRIRVGNQVVYKKLIHSN